MSDGGTSGTIGSYANLNLQQHSVYTVDLSAQDYPQFVSTNLGATHTYEPSSGWNGGPSARLTPPLQGGYSALGSFTNLWRNGTFTIRKLNVRFEVQFGASFGTHWPNDDLKFVIVHTANTLNGATNERPMFNWANASTAGSGILAWAVGAGTVKNFNPPDGGASYFPGSREEFFIGPAPGTHQGRPVIGPAEWLSIELEIISESTAEAPSGRIRSVITLRDGTQLTDMHIPWSYDANWSLPRFISEVQVIGGYYNTGTTAAAPDNFLRLANHITFAANRPGLLGPRAGFIR